jgi:hypothetical protein
MEQASSILAENATNRNALSPAGGVHEIPRPYGGTLVM